MRDFIVRCLLLTKILSILTVITACGVRPGSNITKIPVYWCELDAKLTISSACEVEVEETITVPWTTGTIDRFVPTEDYQTIKDLSAYRISKGQRISTYSIARPQRPPGNVLISIRAAATPGPVTILIRYRKTGAVQMFTHCSGIGEFEELSSSVESTIMVTKWGAGARSAAEILRTQVRFNMPRDPQFRFLDSQALVRETFEQKIDNQAENATDAVIVSYQGITSDILPSELFFFLRYEMSFGSQICSLLRSCVAEDIILREGKMLRSYHKLILGLALGFGFLFVIASVVTWVCCCKWLRQKEPETDQEGDIPDSLRHFTCDTGDDQEGEEEERSQASRKANGKKEEFYPLDLSPKNRGIRDDSGF